jgi:antitoxin component YwqK of YwqJK toxin-antitoxin module
VTEWLIYEDGVYYGKDTYKYDSNGNLTQHAGYDQNGLLSWKQVYTYDSNGNMIEVSYHGENGKLLTKITYKYDSHGNIIEAPAEENPECLPPIAVYEIVYRN